MTLYTQESLEKLRCAIDFKDFVLNKMQLGNVDADVCSYHCHFCNHETLRFSSSSKNHLYCASCKFHGDAIAILMTHKLMGWSEACEQLAAWYNVKLEAIPKKEPRERTLEERVLKLEDYMDAHRKIIDFQMARIKALEAKVDQCQ